MDCGTGHLTIIVGTGGGAFANKKIARRVGYLTSFLQIPRNCPGFTRRDARSCNSLAHKQIKIIITMIGINRGKQYFCSTRLLLSNLQARGNIAFHEKKVCT